MPSPTPRTVSRAGIAKIESREGRENAAYRDSEGIWTIGTGHTGRMSGPPVYAGMYISDAQIDAFLRGDLKPVEAAINAALKVPVTQNQFDAMASLWFNTGIGYIPTSNIIKRLNAGDFAGAAAGFDAYHSPHEIIGRRNGEKAQFLTPDSGVASPSPIPAAKPLKAAVTSAPVTASPPTLFRRIASFFGAH